MTIPCGWISLTLNCLVWVTIVLNIYQWRKYYKLDKELERLIGKLNKEFLDRESQP